MKHRFIAKNPSCKFVTLSVEEMEFYLKNHNKENFRGLNQRTALRYAKDFERGNWGIGESIVFSKEGHLIDGQHRMSGAVEAKTPLKTFVNYGIDLDNRCHMDRHSKRTVSQALGLEDKNASSMVAMANAWFFSENDFSGASKSLITDSDTEQCLNEHRAAIKFIADNKTKYFSRAGFMTACAQYYERDPEAAIEFYNKVVEGEGLKKNTPEYHVRNYLLHTKGGGASRLENDYKSTLWAIHKKHLGIPVLKIRTSQSVWEIPEKKTNKGKFVVKAGSPKSK